MQQLRLVAKFCGSSKVGFAVVRMKERPDGQVMIKGQERAGPSVEAADRSAHLLGFKDVVRKRNISEVLCHCKVLRLRHVPKFLPVLEVVLVQL